MNIFDRNKNRVRVIIYKKNRQSLIKKVKPKNGSFELDGQSYIIDKENYYMHRRIASYSYLEQVPTPLALKSLVVNKKGEESVEFEDVMMSAEELSIFKRSKSAKEVLNSIEKSAPEGLIGGITILVTLVGLGALYYVLNEQIVAVLDQLQAITELLGVGE